MVPAPSGDDADLCPAGLWPAVCTGVEDLGAVETAFGVKNQVRIEFSVTCSNRLYTLARRYNLSLLEKSSLRKDLEHWRGRPFTADELAKNYDLSQVVNKPAQVQVEHVAKTDRTYANIVGLGPARADTPPAAPVTVTPPTADEIPF